MPQNFGVVCIISNLVTNIPMKKYFLGGHKECGSILMGSWQVKEERGIERWHFTGRTSQSTTWLSPLLSQGFPAASQFLRWHFLLICKTIRCSALKISVLVDWWCSKHLLLAQHCVSALFIWNHLIFTTTFWSRFYRCRNWATKKLNNFFHVTDPAQVRSKFRQTGSRDNTQPQLYAANKTNNL